MISIKTDHKSKRVLMTLENYSLRRTHKFGIRDGFYEIGQENVKHTRKLILDPNKNGRIYLIKGKLHQASAPGEAPANLSGALEKSVDYHVRDYEMEFGDKELYGKFLEGGTVKMLPRPHLGRTVNERGTENKNIMEKSIDKRVKNASS